MSVKFTNVTQQYSTQTSPLYENFSAEFAQDKVHAILGVSGSGKTTLLNIISGIIGYTGEVECDNSSYVFQDARLINNITVSDNLRLVLRGAIKDKLKVDSRIKEMLSLAEIEQFADKYPDELSGGQRQRVSLARAFAYPATTLLMDEPFNSLDYGVKERIFAQLNKMLYQSPKTVLFVTHDVDEALTLADDVYMLQGKPVKLTHIASLTDDKDARDIYSGEYVKLRKRIVNDLKQTNN